MTDIKFDGSENSRGGRQTPNCTLSFLLSCVFINVIVYSYILDTFFSENNGARMILCGLNDSSVQAELNDTHYDHDIKIIGSRLGP